MFNQLTQERLGQILDEQQQEPETTTPEEVSQEPETTTSEAESQDLVSESLSSEEISGIDHDDHYDSPQHERFVKYQKLQDKTYQEYTTEKNKAQPEQVEKKKHLVGTYESQNYDLKIFAKKSNYTRNKTPQEWLDVIKKFSVS